MHTHERIWTQIMIIVEKIKKIEERISKLEAK